MVNCKIENKNGSDPKLLRLKEVGLMFKWSHVPIGCKESPCSNRTEQKNHEREITNGHWLQL